MKKPPDPRRKAAVRVIQALVSVVVVVVMFVLVIPKMADYHQVWKVITQLTWLELAGLVLATIFNLFTYWWQMMAAMPRLTTGQAAVNNQTTTTIANILPAGGAIAVGLAVAIFRSWGFTVSAITLEITLDGHLEQLLQARPAGHRAGARRAHRAGIRRADRAGPRRPRDPPRLRRRLRPDAVEEALREGDRRRARARVVGDQEAVPQEAGDGLGDRAVRFRHDTIELLGRRWIPLTLTTILSQMALYLVLLLALRDVGVSEQEISWAQVLAVFAFGRLITALPITPGGVGVIEAAYIAALIAIGKGHADVDLTIFDAQVAAAVLLFRTLTYGIQIPLGGFTYIIWRAKKSWRKTPPDEHRGLEGEPAMTAPLPG